jgi:SAM-dependent methyltransferase
MSDDTPSIASPDYWESAAAGWTLHQDLFRSYTAPVSQWLVDAVAPTPGERLLELAAGMGETGFMAAPALLPGGMLICSDRAEAMLAGARARAQELGLPNVEFKTLDGEWIDLPVADVDAVVCRWGYMLMDDPAAALRETRRVLRPEGRLALATWDRLDRNPWAAEPGEVLRRRGLTGPQPADGPGPFALHDPAALTEMLHDAGFGEVRIDAVDLTEAHRDFDSYFSTRLDLSRSFHDAVMSQSQAIIDEVRAELAERLAPYTAPGGALAIPGRSLVASATA